MEENENVQLIKSLFEVFGKGDIPTVLGMLDEQVEWKSPVTKVIHRDTVSWASPRNSPGEVAQFFKELGENMVPEPFHIHGYVAQGDTVVVEGSNKGKVRSTNRAYEHDWVMIFKVSDGKIKSCHHYYDTADLEIAFKTIG
jgi:hypothetical protein